MIFSVMIVPALESSIDSSSFIIGMEWIHFTLCLILLCVHRDSRVLEEMHAGVDMQAPNARAPGNAGGRSHALKARLHCV